METKLTGLNTPFGVVFWVKDISAKDILNTYF